MNGSMALEQPTIPWLIFNKVDDFSETAYLDRYGFIPDTIIPGKKALPIGFAQGGPMLDPTGAPWKNPRTKRDMTGVGLTCAACHTGSFTYKDTAVVIDGGPALTDLFTDEAGHGRLAGADALTARPDSTASPRRILGPDSTVADRETLKDQLDQVLQAVQAKVRTWKSASPPRASWKVTDGWTRSTGSATRCFQST